MADRLSQLQDCINEMASHMCNSIGVLQQSTSPPVGDKTEQDNAALFAKLITQTAKDIDVLVDSLPDNELPRDAQTETYNTLNKMNADCAEQLKSVVDRGQQLLNRISDVLEYIDKVEQQIYQLRTEQEDI